MHHRTGAVLFAFLLVLDQITKMVVLEHLAGQPAVEVTSFFNLVLVWNRGVSFGMFSTAGDWGPVLLILLAVAIGVLLIWWLARESRPVPRLGIWLVLAGAVGNLIDRIRFGAVIDFLDFHVAGYHWPAFNVADSAIVIGAGLLLLDGFVLSRGSLEKVRENG